ncbi:MAG TPA: alkaline phosphatase family protein [Candidatus Angelobacter sp.]
MSWTTQNATSLTIDNGVGQVAVPSGSVMVKPMTTTMFTATASGPNGTASGATTVTTKVEGVTTSNHVYIVVLENHSFESVMGNPDTPNLNRMATTFGVATNYFANVHHSIGDYFEMTTGQVITTDDTFTTTVTVDNLVRHMITAGKTWHEYSECLPNAGYFLGSMGCYVQHHNPLAYFSDVRGTAQANNLVPFTQLQADITAGTLPNFGLIIPDNDHNAHTGTLADADTWLQTNVFQPLLSSPPFQANGDGLLVVVFDESLLSDIANGGGHIPAVLIGPLIKAGFQSAAFYQHQSLLRTVCDALQMPPFGDAVSTTPMADFFK